MSTRAFTATDYNETEYYASCRANSWDSNPGRQAARCAKEDGSYTLFPLRTKEVNSAPWWVTANLYDDRSKDSCSGMKCTLYKYRK